MKAYTQHPKNKADKTQQKRCPACHCKRKNQGKQIGKTYDGKWPFHSEPPLLFNRVSLSYPFRQAHGSADVLQSALHAPHNL